MSQSPKTPAASPDTVFCPVRNVQGREFLIPCGDSEEWARLTAKELRGLINAQLHASTKLDRVLRRSYGFIGAGDDGSAVEEGQHSSATGAGASDPRRDSTASLPRQHTGYALPIPPSLIALVKEDGDALEDDALVAEHVSPAPPRKTASADARGEEGGE